MILEISIVLNSSKYVHTLFIIINTHPVQLNQFRINTNKLITYFSYSTVESV